MCFYSNEMVYYIRNEIKARVYYLLQYCTNRRLFLLLLQICLKSGPTQTTSRFEFKMRFRKDLHPSFVTDTQLLLYTATWNPRVRPISQSRVFTKRRRKKVQLLEND